MCKEYRIPKENMYDTDKLTDSELSGAGLSPNGVSEARHKRSRKKKRLPTCIYCKKPVKNPITSFEILGDDILDGSTAHSTCVTNHVLELLTTD